MWDPVLCKEGSWWGQCLQWEMHSKAVWEAEEKKELPHMWQTPCFFTFPNQKEIKGCLVCQRSPQKLGPAFEENYLNPKNWKNTFYYISRTYFHKTWSKKYIKLRKLCYHYHLSLQACHFLKQRATKPSKGNVQAQTYWHIYYKSVSAGFYLKSKLFQWLILWLCHIKIKKTVRKSQ